MPIHLQWLDEPNQQDCIDLDKLYADAPESWAVNSVCDSGSEWALGQLGLGALVALGRFNDRIVCAACVIRQSEVSTQPYLYDVKQVCVRSITRERGVAKQLLVRLCQWADDTTSSLFITDEAGKLASLYELGFTQYLTGWRYLPR